MAKRNHLCDTGCGRDRLRWQRICETCFSRLPGDIKHGIIDCFKCGAFKEWRAWKKRAREYLATANPQSPLHDSAPPRGPITPEQAYALNQRRMGEHDD